jgi:hypothetical protein
MYFHKKPNNRRKTKALALLLGIIRTKRIHPDSLSNEEE